MEWPALSVAAIFERTARRWDFSGPLPVPRDGWLACPICMEPAPQPRVWKFHRIGKSQYRTPTWPFRCDVSFKCTDCAMVWTHGVAVPETMYEAAPKDRQIEWRDARRLLEGGGD